jgi:hypothetical protein
VVIEAIDDRHIDRRTPQRFGGFEPAESRTDDDDVRALAGTDVGCDSLGGDLSGGCIHVGDSS